MGIKLANNAFGTLAAGIASDATSITLTTGHGDRFPFLGAGDYFYATLIDTSNNLEIVKCTTRSTDVLTVVRAQESTTARAYSAGDRVEIRITAQTFSDAVNEIGPTQVSDEANTSTGYMMMPVGTTAQRPASPQTGMYRMNSTTGEPEWYDSVNSQWTYFSDEGGYRIKNIRTLSAVGSGTFTPTPGTRAMMVRVLGGGGSGAYSTDGTGGGGGGGGGCAFAFITQVDASYNYTVGAGGALAAQGAYGNNGMASSFSTPSSSFSITGEGGVGGRTHTNWGYRFGGGGGSGSITSSPQIAASIIYPGQCGLGGMDSREEGSAGAAGGGNHLFCNSECVGHYQASQSTPLGCGGNGNLGRSSFTPSKGGDGFILIWELV